MSRTGSFASFASDKAHYRITFCFQMYERKQGGMVCDELKSGSNLEDYVRAQVAAAAAAGDGSRGQEL